MVEEQFSDFFNCIFVDPNHAILVQKALCAGGIVAATAEVLL